MGIQQTIFMNYKQLLEQRNKIKNLIRISNRHKNVLRWSSNETDSHLNMKLEICKYLKKNNLEFYTECIFLNGKRADIVVADLGFIIEILNSEKEESIKNKQKFYPLEIRTINTNQEFREELIL